MKNHQNDITVCSNRNNSENLRGLLEVRYFGTNGPPASFPAAVLSASWTHPAGAQLAWAALSCCWLMDCLKGEDAEPLWACAWVWLACCRCRLSPHKEAAVGAHESMCESLFACLHSSPPFLHTHTLTHLRPELFHHPRRAAHTPKHLGYGPIDILYARMQNEAMAWLSKALPHACKILQCNEDTQEESRGGDVCSVSVTNYRTDPQPRDYLTQNTIATEPAASLNVPVMAHLKLIPRCPWEKVAQGHAIWYSMWRAAALQESWAVKGRILCVGLINVSVIRRVFFITGPKTLHHTAPLPGPLKRAKRHPALHVKQTVAGHLDCRWRREVQKHLWGRHIFSSSLSVPPHCPLRSDRPRIISS